MCSDAPPLEVVVTHMDMVMEQKKLFGIAKISLTWIDRKVSLSMGHGTCMRRVRGSREARDAGARVASAHGLARRRLASRLMGLGKEAP